MHPLFEGILVGLTLSILLGPAFFTLIQTSIHRGMISGLFVAGGVFLSDLALVILCYVGVSQIIYQGTNSLIFGIIGGIILILYGVFTFKRVVHPVDNGDIQVRKPGIITYILKWELLPIMVSIPMKVISSLLGSF